jgi:prophage maintenance system killer protein
MLFAMTNGYDSMATPQELFDITMAVAQGQVQVEALAIWFRQHLKASEN